MLGGAVIAAAVYDAALQEDQNSFEFAQELCESEVEFVSEHYEYLEESLKAFKVPEIRELPEDQYSAVLKARLSTAIRAEFFADMASYKSQLKEKRPITEDLKNERLAQLRLLECLTLTQRDRALIDRAYETMVEKSDVKGIETSTVDEVVSREKGKLLAVIDAMECRRHNEYSRRILSIDPASSDVAAQLDLIMEDTAGRCEKES